MRKTVASPMKKRNLFDSLERITGTTGNKNDNPFLKKPKLGRQSSFAAEARSKRRVK